MSRNNGRNSNWTHQKHLQKKGRNFRNRQRRRRRNGANSEIYSSDEIDRFPKKIISAGASISPKFLMKLQLYWQKMSTQQKVLCTIALLLTAGFTMYAAYHLFTAYMVMLDEELADRRVPNRLTRHEIRLFKKQQCPKISVQADPDLSRYMIGAPEVIKDQFESEMKIYKRRVKKAVCDVATTRQQHETLSSSDFKIQITAPKEISGVAAFDGEKNAMLFAIESKYNQYDIETAALNELHHAQVRMQNQKNACTKAQDILLLSEPFCLPGGTLDWDKADQLIAAINDDHSKINDFYAIFTKRQQGKILSWDEENLLNKGLIALKTYQTFEQTMIISVDRFRREFQPYLYSTNDPGEPFYMPSQYFNLPKSVIVLADQYFSRIEKISSSKMYLLYRFGKKTDLDIDKVGAFLSEWSLIHYGAVSAESSHYSVLKTTSRFAELASFIEHFPSEVKKTFFPEFCHYFSEFFNKADYCDHASVGHRF